MSEDVVTSAEGTLEAPAGPEACEVCGKTRRPCDCEMLAGLRELGIDPEDDPTLATEPMGPRTNEVPPGLDDNAVAADDFNAPETLEEPMAEAVAEVVGGPQTSLAVRPPQGSNLALVDGLRPEDAARVASFTAAASAPATVRVYASFWRDFEAWCEAQGKEPVGASARLVAAYLTGLADPNRVSSKKRGSLKVASIQSALSAIAFHHRLYNLPFDTRHPIIQKAMDGIRRLRGSSVTRKLALRGDDMEKLLTYAKPWEKALLDVGWCTALRRQTLCRMTLNCLGPEGIIPCHCGQPHLRFGELKGREYVEVWIPHDKTDQEGTGRRLQVFAAPELTEEEIEDGKLDRRAYCMVRELKLYLPRLESEGSFDVNANEMLGFGVIRGRLAERVEAELSVVSSAAPRPRWLFPSPVRAGAHLDPRQVPIILKRLARKAGYSEAQVESISGHSLRRGFGVTMFEDGMPIDHICRHYGHSDPKTTLIYLDTAEGEGVNPTF